MTTEISHHTHPASIETALQAFGRDVSMARRVRRLTMEQAARLAGLTRDTWARLERGDGGVSLGTVARALGALGLLEMVAQLADPGRDRAGLELLRARLPRRVRDGRR